MVSAPFVKNANPADRSLPDLLYNKTIFPLKMARVQQRRPLPVAETGRNCWGSGLQDASAAPRHEADAGCRNPSGPAHRNRCDLAALNTRHLLRKPVCGLKAPLGLSCPPGTAVLSGSLLVPKENNPRPVKHFHRSQKLLFISCFSASTVRGESTRGCCGRPSGRRTARRSPC